MLYVITSNSFATPSAYIKSSENATFVASYLNAYTKPWHRWWASDCVSGTTYCGLQFAAPTTVAAVVLDNVNVDSVKIQAHTSDSWATPDYDSGAIAVSQDVIDGRYKLYYPVTGTVTKAFWRCVSNDGTPNDGSSVMKVGSMVCLTAVTTWTTNPGFPYEAVPMQAVLESDFTAGGGEPAEVGHRYCDLNLNQPVMPLAMKSTLFTLAGTYSKATPFVFYRNDGDTSEVYIVRRVADARIAQAGPNHYSMSGLVLREYV